MKIIAVRGMNLASLEGNFEVNFNQEPLASAGIFAITGTTGSGKSTLLDALCLALYSETPRLYNAKGSDDILDVKEKTIKATDARNLLRRGCAEGYAEVEFTALNGMHYRARWSVARARNKADGNLQAALQRLYNVTEGEVELSGTKTEILNQIVELTGLSFAQFTRAVLLAQGDFATFLKADKNEKAELLEKLTGTEIYSLISQRIFEKSKEAEEELKRIEERIGDIALLSSEELVAIEQRQEELNQMLQQLESQKRAVEAKLGWYQQEKALKSGVLTAQTALKEAQEKVPDEQEHGTKLMFRFESIFPKYDSFMSYRALKKQHFEDENALKDAIFNHDSKLEISERSKELLTSDQEKLQELQKKSETLVPQILRVRAIEVQQSELSKQHKTAAAEVNAQLKAQAVAEEAIASIQKSKAETAQKRQEITAWFENYSAYRTIVPSVELIVTQLNDLQQCQKGMAQATESMTLHTKQLAQCEANLATQQAEQSKLNATLSSEIAQLRNQLVAHEPCPVCGSTEHPWSKVESDTLKEEALERAKQAVATAIETLNQSMMQHREALAREQSLKENYEQRTTGLQQTLGEALKELANWKELFEQGRLINALQQLAKQWQSNEQLQQQCLEAEQQQNQKLEMEQQQQHAISEQLESRKHHLAELKAQIDALTQERSQLLGGESADSVEQQLKIEKTKLEIEIEQHRKSVQFYALEASKHGALRDELQKREAITIPKMEQMEQELTIWMKEHHIEDSFANAVELAKLDPGFFVRQRKEYEALKENVTKADMTLKERQRVLEEHMKLGQRPQDTESETVLNEAMKQYSTQQSALQKETSELLVQQRTHDEGLKRKAMFQEEYAQKEGSAITWQRLNLLLGSAKGDKFKVLAQGYTLDILLGYANLQLKDITPRYLLERVAPDSLALQVIDQDMLSEVRSVHSLSGGESFLISLSLALGLSSLSSNRMRIESLFIDEGFGSLDADTLRIAMDALEKLQSTQGRKIGVISHVAEMTERIQTQIRVIKDSNGRSHIEVV